MLFGMICALGSSLCFGMASVLQALGAREATPGTGAGVDVALQLRVMRKWRYLAGLSLDGIGFGLQVVALLTLPIYMVGAALAASLAVTAVAASWLLKVPLHRMEWAAVGVVCVGLAMLALASGDEGEQSSSEALRWAMLAAAFGVLALGAAAGRLPGRPRALALGLCAGFGFGVVEVAVRLIDSWSLANPAVYALLLGGVTAYVLLTSALQRGSVTTATAGAVLGETIGPALVGVIWLGDRTREGLAWLAILGFTVAVAGALVLARFGEPPTPSPEPEAEQEPAPTGP